MMSRSLVLGLEGAIQQVSECWEAVEIHFGQLPEAPQSRSAWVPRSAKAHAVAWWWELDLGKTKISSWTEAHQGIRT